MRVSCRNLCKDSLELEPEPLPEIEEESVSGIWRGGGWTERMSVPIGCSLGTLREGWRLVAAREVAVSMAKTGREV